ncbi:MAG: DUF899 family protein [Gammaproteobacteria bacterium]|nr:DUF899 family protein [Gammaproteobacteria bacterium]
MSVAFPNEPSDYRAARDQLLQAEIRLRQQVAEVAEQRRRLPLGGQVKEDYEFAERRDAGRIRPVKMSQLFGPHDSLFLYSFMYGPQAELPCPMCSSLLDALNGNAPHINQRTSLAVAARSDIERVAEFAERRGWHNLRLLSSRDTDYNSDYLAENAAGEQFPMANVFVRREGRIHHFWGSELFYADVDGQPRHMDLMWPLWNVLDTLPAGRGEDWYPSLGV